MSTIKIYTLSDPLTGDIRYVGKTIQTLKVRLSKHTTDRQKNEKNRWIRSLTDVGLIPVIEVIDEPEERHWKLTEQYWISQFKAWGYNLTNISSGGDSGGGRKHSEETRALLAKLQFGRTYSSLSKQKMRESRIKYHLENPTDAKDRYKKAALTMSNKTEEERAAKSKAMSDSMKAMYSTKSPEKERERANNISKTKQLKKLQNGKH